MPSPSTIVTFKDADGDEFPIRLWGNHTYTASLARKELDRMIREGRMRPTEPTHIVRVERP